MKFKTHFCGNGSFVVVAVVVAVIVIVAVDVDVVAILVVVAVVDGPSGGQLTLLDDSKRGVAEASQLFL